MRPLTADSGRGVSEGKLRLREDDLFPSSKSQMPPSKLLLLSSSGEDGVLIRQEEGESTSNR